MRYIRIYNAFNRQLLTYKPMKRVARKSKVPRLFMGIVSWSSACPFDSCPFSSAYHPLLTCANCRHSINKPLNYEP